MVTLPQKAQIVRKTHKFLPFKTFSLVPLVLRSLYHGSQGNQFLGAWGGREGGRRFKLPKYVYKSLYLALKSGLTLRKVTFGCPKCRGLYSPPPKAQYLEFEFFQECKCSFYFIEKSDFFFLSKKLPSVTKTLSFQENLRFDNLEHVFPAFCTICMTKRRPKACKCAQF